MPLDSLPFAARLAAYRDLLIADLRTRGPLRLLTQMHGNIGDRLIWSGTAALMATAGLASTDVPLPDVVTGRFPEECLVVPGSGALTRMWHEWLPQLIIDASERFRSVLILPSQYDPSLELVAAALAKPNVHAYAREAASFRAARPFGRTGLAFDPALFCPLLGPTPQPENEVAEPRRRLVVFREDRSSRLAELGHAVHPTVNRDIGSRSRDLDEFVAVIREADEVITDRLHVAVTAVLLGKRLGYFDPHERKISTYFAFTFRDEFAATARPCSLEELVAMGCIIPSRHA